MRAEMDVLYKYSVKGVPQQWQIIAEDDKFWTIEGQVGGKLTTSLPTVCTGKNIGRSNETTPEQQAILEAQSKFDKKKTQGSYNEVITEEKNHFEPMLAFEMEKYEKLLFTVPTFIQPKMDGIRGVNMSNTIKTRNGKDILTCPHLYQDETILDGELYNHEFYDDFNEIISVIKQQKPTLEDIIKAKDKAQFWCYDFPLHKGVFSERYKALLQWHHNKFGSETNVPFKIVPTFQIFSLEDIKRYHRQFNKEGYEGSIIRLDLAEYENKRSKQLLKYKDWMDAEFEIIGYEEGSGGRANTIGCFWVRLDLQKPFVISDNAKKRVNCCKSNVRGVFKYLKDIWDNKDYYIGKQATIEFQGYTPKGSLRFPYIIKLDRQSYE